MMNFAQYNLYIIDHPYTYNDIDSWHGIDPFAVRFMIIIWEYLFWKCEQSVQVRF